jgi:hypothetical protein
MAAAEQLLIANNTVYGRKGMVDFSPVQKIVPGSPQPFPPASVQPDSVGDNTTHRSFSLRTEAMRSGMRPIGGNVDADYHNQFCDGVPANRSADF